MNASDVAEVLNAAWDPELSAYLVKRDGPWLVHVAPLIFNDRVLLTHVDEYPHTWTAGYCYDKGPAAALAAAVWEPTRQARPAGYKKIAAEADRELDAEPAP